MAKNYYAVRKGRTPGIYETWKACQEEVHGYPGAEFKKFAVHEDAVAYVTGEEQKQAQYLPTKDRMVVYVDGSYNAEEERFGYGVVLFTEKGKETLSGGFTGPYAKYRNVAGEVFAAMKAMDEAISRGMKELVIHYDYMGIKHWALGEWKTNTLLTQKYHAYAVEKQKALSLVFVKVKAHSGDMYNEEADILAKEGSGIQKRDS